MLQWWKNPGYIVVVFLLCITGIHPQDVHIPQMNPSIYSLHIRSDIAYRFATTHVTSQLANTAQDAKEAYFSVTLPKAAFITKFSMEIDGKVYDGDVKEKEAAKKQYEKAKSKGQSAGKVSAKPRETNVFQVSVNVAGQSKVYFNLTYQELLERKLGLYEHVININPGQVVRDLSVNVYIRESRELTLLKVPPLRTSDLNTIEATDNHPLAVIHRISETAAHVSYQPDIQTQQEESEDGIHGQFVIQYDVLRDLDAGEIQVVDGYFVHYFAPSGLPPVNKNVLFILDKSSSMSGSKIRQTKEAMLTILAELREGDMFNLVTFSYNVDFWQPTMTPVTKENIKKAKLFINRIVSGGGTNINDALLRGLAFLKALHEEREEEENGSASMIIFLTDGDPSSGITNPTQIMSNVRSSNGERFTLFNLGFGNDVDFPFLQKMALQNRGLARKVYAESDASLQLQGFYNEISTPVLSSVNIKYLDGAVDAGSITDTDFFTYFKGSEIIVAGKLADNTINNFASEISAQGAGGDIDLDMNVKVMRMEPTDSGSDVVRFTERLWAYLTIKKLLDKMLQSSDAAETATAKAKALEMSLKYSFVTPLTSMVVTKPEAPNKNIGDLADPAEKPRYPTYPQGKQRYKYSGGRGGGRGGSSVDLDPHFIVMLPGVEEAICFDVTGKPGEILQILHDKAKKIIVNGKVVGKPGPLPPHRKQPQTYIGQIAILAHWLEVLITPSKVDINGILYSWHETLNVTLDGVAIQIIRKKRVNIWLGDDIAFTVLRHKVAKVNNNKVDFLGFYIANGKGLSKYTHGLIGQFQHQTAMMLNTSLDRDNPWGVKTMGSLHFKGHHFASRTVTARLGQRRNMVLNAHVPCWHVRNNGKGFIEGRPIDYIVPKIKSKVYVMDKQLKQKTGNHIK